MKFPHWLGLIFTLVLSTFPALAGPDKLEISGAPPPKELQVVLGNGWAIFLDGEIDEGAAKRLDAFIEQNKVPYTSYVFLNSPGGNLFAGMELGRIIRKHGLRTDMGSKPQEGDRTRLAGPGICFSACALAYIGGVFRFMSEGGRYGVHRFFSTTNIQNEGDVAQIVSASIINYLKEMDVDVELFALMTSAGRSQIFEPPAAMLRQLRVVNDGASKEKWTVEGSNGVVYVKGEKDTVYGINKFMLLCQSGQVALYVIFDAQGRAAEILASHAHSLVVNGNDEAIKPIDFSAKNGWVNATYQLDRRKVNMIVAAASVGLRVRASYTAPFFFGFEGMKVEDGREKIRSFLNSCGYRF